MEKLVCVFCENIYEADTFICNECQDYKGLMPIGDAAKEYDFLEYLAEQRRVDLTFPPKWGRRLCNEMVTTVKKRTKSP